MHTSKLIKSILKYLPLLAVIVLVVLGVSIAKDLHQTSLGSQLKTPAQSATKQIKPPLLPNPVGTGSCALPNVYTSLPAKCKTADGKFIQGNNWSLPIIPMIPELK